MHLVNPADREALDNILRGMSKDADAAKPKKAFTHREPPAQRCKGIAKTVAQCQLWVRVGRRDVCQASGKTITENDGRGNCAYTPVRTVASDDG